jgi:hypothetical protein
MMERAAEADGKRLRSRPDVSAEVRKEAAFGDFKKDMR